MNTTRMQSGLSWAMGAALLARVAYGDLAPQFSGIKSQPPPAATKAGSAAAKNADAALKRLGALSEKLQAALLDLKKAPADSADGGIFERAVGEINSALAVVAEGTAYVHAHPETDALPAEPLVAVPNLNPATGFAILNQAKVKDSYPTLVEAENFIHTGLLDFINGASTSSVRYNVFTNPGAGIVIGPLGGYRDKIIQNVATAEHHLTSDFSDREQRGIMPKAPDVSAVQNKPGSISGVVVDSDGDPAANVLIGLTAGAELRAQAEARYTIPPPDGTTPLRGFAANVARMSPEQRQSAINSQATPRSTGTYPAGVPVTITNEKGEFTITGLAPDIYIVTGSLVGAQGGWTMEGSIQPITVKEDTATKLAKPLQLN